MPDVIVTGMPRSGLTVVAALIDGLPDAVCINRPARHSSVANSMSGILPYCQWLMEDFDYKRDRLLSLKSLPDCRTADGLPLLDGIRDPRQPRTEEGGSMVVDIIRPGLPDDFILGQKHHALYTAILPTLVQFDRFKIIAVIRHPLDVIASWLSLPERPIGQAKLPMDARLWPEAARIAATESPLLDRMAQLYDLYVQVYHAFGDHLHIVKYEDVVHDPMMVSRLFYVETLSEIAPLIEKRPRIRQVADADSIRESVRKYGVFTRIFYPNI